MNRTSQVTLINSQLAVWLAERGALKEYWDLCDGEAEKAVARSEYMTHLKTKPAPPAVVVVPQQPTTELRYGGVVAKELDMGPAALLGGLGSSAIGTPDAVDVRRPHEVAMLGMSKGDTLVFKSDV